MKTQGNTLKKGIWYDMKKISEAVEILTRLIESLAKLFFALSMFYGYVLILLRG